MGNCFGIHCPWCFLRQKMSPSALVSKSHPICRSHTFPPATPQPFGLFSTERLFTKSAFLCSLHWKDPNSFKWEHDHTGRNWHQEKNFAVASKSLYYLLITWYLFENEYFKVSEHKSKQKGMEFCYLLSPFSDLKWRTQSAWAEQRSGVFLSGILGRRCTQGPHPLPTAPLTVAAQGALANWPDIPPPQSCSCGWGSSQHLISHLEEKFLLSGM